MEETKLLKILSLYHQTNHFGKLLGMLPNIPKPGEAEYTMLVEQKHLATPIAAHGGVIASLIDGTLGVAALSYTALENKVVSTVEMKVNFLKPVVLKDTLLATGKVISAGKRLLFVECQVTNQHNE